MSLSGRLTDVSVVELLQFLHLGGRTGTLRLSDGVRTGTVTVSRGRTVGATGPGTLALGPLLVEAQLIGEADLGEAQDRQLRCRPRPPLDAVLAGMKAVARAALLGAVEAQIKACVYELVTWTEGTFEFDTGHVETLEDLGPAEGEDETLPVIELHTQEALLEGVRRVDERARAGHPGAPPAEPGAVRVRDARPTVPVRPLDASAEWLRSACQLVSKDVELARQVGARMTLERVRAVRVAVRDAGAAGPDEDPPVVLLDLRAGAASLEDVRAIRAAHPRALLLALPSVRVTATALYAAGATAVLGPEPEIIAACALSLLANVRDSAREAAIERGVREGFAKVLDLMQGLRSGTLSSALALNLMGVASEAFERAVAFQVRRGELRTLGAFGAASDGRPLAEATRSFAVPLRAAGGLCEGLDDGRARVVPFENAHLPEALAHLLGPPRTGDTAIFPVLGGQGLVAVLYADNGSSGRAFGRVESLEIATAQIGLCFENQLLRAQLAARGGQSGLLELGA